MSFIQSNSVTFDEIEGRRNADKDLLSFGIDYLNDSCAGILKNDLILLGAPSGAGKTQACCNIALENVLMGKKVHYIALEAEKLEIERRIKYQLFSKHFFQDSNRPNETISFQNWMLGRFLNSCEKYEALAASEFAEKTNNLFSFYKSEKFDVDDLILKGIQAAGDNTNLIIVDHVHYFDFDDDNENRAIKKIAQASRTMAIDHGIPIILVSHLRKRDRSSQDLVPGMEEFHGSSDLFKISTKAIIIAPGKSTSNGKYETYIRVAKNRWEGSAQRYIASCNYLIKEGKYEQGYVLGDVNQKRDEDFRELSGTDDPQWAIHKRSPIGIPSPVYQNPKEILKKYSFPKNNGRPYKED